MDDKIRLIILLQQLFDFEDGRLAGDVANTCFLMQRNEKDSYYIMKYYRAVVAYEYFKILRKKVFEIVNCF